MDVIPPFVSRGDTDHPTRPVAPQPFVEMALEDALPVTAAELSPKTAGDDQRAPGGQHIEPVAHGIQEHGIRQFPPIADSDRYQTGLGCDARKPLGIKVAVSGG
jgi:hypothetical protein